MILSAAYTSLAETNRIRSMSSMRSPYWLFVVLILLLGGLQYRLWVGEGSLAQVSGREVTMVADVDPDILGGVVARLGTTVYDGSVAGHLERIRNNLLAR